MKKSKQVSPLRIYFTHQLATTYLDFHKKTLGLTPAKCTALAYDKVKLIVKNYANTGKDLMLASDSYDDSLTTLYLGYWDIEMDEALKLINNE